MQVKEGITKIAAVQNTYKPDWMNLEGFSHQNDYYPHVVFLQNPLLGC